MDTALGRHTEPEAVLRDRYEGRLTDDQLDLLLAIKRHHQTEGRHATEAVLTEMVRQIRSDRALKR